MLDDSVIGDMKDCGWCGQVTRIVWSAGHGQCMSCGRITEMKTEESDDKTVGDT